MEDFVLSDFFEITPDLVWIAGKDGFLKKVNHSVIKKMGFTEAELCSKPVIAFMHPDDIEKTIANRNKLFQGEVMQNYCNRYITKQGDVLWLEWTSVYLADKEIILAIAKDITSRKNIELEVNEQFNTFKGLTTHFKSRIENDRKYFAYELHEELAQLVAVINMDVGWLNMHLGDMPEKLRARAEHASVVSKLLIKTIQRLAFSISPQMLYDLGLSTTMEWLCTEYTVLNSINCTFEGDYDENAISEEMKIDFFRICQEVLSEIVNHAKAGNISISINEVEDQVELLIQDSGNGLSSEQEKQKKGLTGIKERVKSFNGKLTFQHKGNGYNGISITVKKSENLTPRVQLQ